MLTPKQIKEIRGHLERAQNPIFYYDNDADGLCSYVLLRKFLDRGKGVAIRSFPEIDKGYARKARELNADYVFVLDKPVLSEDFVKAIEEMGLPLIWIDHHKMPIEEYEGKAKNFFVYNPTRNKGKSKSDEPVTYLCYKITERKEDLWIAVAGCIADHYLPDFVSEFKEMYGEFWGENIKEPFNAYFKTEIGRIAKAINFGLKDSTSNIIRLQNFLISCSVPGEVFAETGANYSFRKKYNEIKKKYDALVERAHGQAKGRVLFFEYSGELSISSDIANELFYNFPEKIIVVAYKKEGVTNLSLRGKKVRAILEKVLKEVDGIGGGHEEAVGARIKTEDLGKFREILNEETSKSER